MMQTYVPSRRNTTGRYIDTEKYKNVVYTIQVAAEIDFESVLSGLRQAADEGGIDRFYGSNSKAIEDAVTGIGEQSLAITESPNAYPILRRRDGRLYPVDEDIAFIIGTVIVRPSRGGAYTISPPVWPRSEAGG